ncbi:Hypothetical protein FKW44_021631, partial [Caligus rogercresseyi]
MSSELERRTATYCDLRCGPCAKEIIDIFKFPKLLFTALPSPSRSRRTIEEGFLTPEKKDSRSIPSQEEERNFIDRLHT